MLVIKIDRAWKKDTYTISRLFLNNKRFYEALEDKDRGLHQNDPISKIWRTKVYGETAIPKGRYRVRMDIVSPKYQAIPWYNKLCGGRMPRVMDVPGFEGILFHPGTDAQDTLGCILVGRNTVVGKLTQSRATFEKFVKELQKADSRGEEIYLEVL